jgi:nitrate reductase NapE component
MLSSTGSCLLKMMLLPVSFVVITLAVLTPAVHFEERARTVTVGEDIPALFPVVVRYGHADGAGEARIVFHRHLEAFMEQVPNPTFRVEPEEAASLKKGLPSLHQVMATPHEERHFGAGGFEVEDLGNGRQRFEVSGTWDDDRVNKGWYETDGQTIEAQRYVVYFGPGIALMYSPIIVIASLGFWAFAMWLWERRRRRSTLVFGPPGAPR